MIREIRLENYKGHRDTTIPCERFTVLVGANGVGKSSVLQAVDDVGSLATRGMRSPLALAEAFTHRHGRGEGGLRVTLSHEAHGQRWALGYATTARDEAPALVYAVGDDALKTLGIVDFQQRSSLAKLGLPVDAAPIASRTRLMRLDPPRLAEPSSITNVSQPLRENGYGLASLLAEMKLGDDQRFNELNAAVRAVVPRVTALKVARRFAPETRTRVMQVEGQAVPITESVNTLFDVLTVRFDDEVDLPASEASDGTLLVIGVLALLHDPAAPRVVLLDDLDRGLHPEAQVALVKSLRAILDQRLHVQIIATTHSPDLVNAMRPEEVVVLGRGPDGVRAKRLIDHPQHEELRSLTSGEFWLAEGEAWAAQ